MRIFPENAPHGPVKNRHTVMIHRVAVAASAHPGHFSGAVCSVVPIKKYWLHPYYMEFLKLNYIWAITAVMSGAGLIILSLRQKVSGPKVSSARATQLINREDAQVIDVRDQAEWAKGRISGSRHIPLAELDKRMGELEKFKQRPVIVACASGSRSSSACSALRKAGFEQVFALDGGLGAWEQAGLPLTKK
jgi:rhodanese-related sulfurtransferase